MRFGVSGGVATNGTDGPIDQSQAGQDGANIALNLVTDDAPANARRIELGEHLMHTLKQNRTTHQVFFIMGQKLGTQGLELGVTGLDPEALAQQAPCTHGGKRTQL